MDLERWPAIDNLMKTVEFAGLALEGFIKTWRLRVAGCVSYRVSNMFHTCFIPRGSCAGLHFELSICDGVQILRNLMKSLGFEVPLFESQMKTYCCEVEPYQTT